MARSFSFPSVFQTFRDSAHSQAALQRKLAAIVWLAVTFENAAVKVVPGGLFITVPVIVVYRFSQRSLPRSCG